MIQDLQRNDTEGAIAFFRAAVMTRAWGPDVAQILIQLQDDPTEYLERWREVSQEPAVAAALARIRV